VALKLRASGLYAAKFIQTTEKPFAAIFFRATPHNMVIG
jgi:hypothetical protein